MSGCSLEAKHASARTRTRSEVKWLANELAAVTGELERIEVELARLQARKEHLLGVRAALSAVAGLLTVPELPSVVPAVKTHRDLGGRGSLRNCIREALKAAHPQALDTLALTEVVVARFGLTFPNAKARQRFRKYSVNHTLQKLQARGEVERLHDFRVTPNSVGAWRWRVQVLTLDELRSAQSLETEEAPWR
jgi:hypothetical protein